ncbi:MAG: penicillin-binding protein activator [Candidatus Pacebacteria bacterium]|nr:penicillin-binding protein activator [Candidatus Paceibacterota bacterium]
MNKNIKIILGLIVAILVVWEIYSISQNSGEPMINEPIKIGFVSALSGEAVTWGEPVKKGFDFAVEQINSNGGINGRLIEPIYEDDACNAKTGINAFSKLIDINKVKIITGSVCSSVAMSVIPKTQNNRVLYIASAATDPDVPKQGDLVFRLSLSDSYEAKEIGNYAVKNLGLKNLSIIHINDNPAGISQKDNFKLTVESNGGNIVSTEAVLSTEKDFRTVLTKLISSKAEGVYIMVAPEQMPIIINQLREIGYKGIILAYAPSVYAEGVAEKINDISNIYYAMPITKQETEFWQKYENVNNTEADLIMAIGYDSMKLIESGLKYCGEDNECMKDYFLTLHNYPTSRGLISFDENGDLTGIDFEVKQLQ